jgi:hypothetical protein
MSRIQTYYLIGNLLTADSNPERREDIIKSLQSPTLNWPLFIATGSNHLVLQTIYFKLQEQKLTEYVPSEVLAHLKNVSDLNERRNTKIIQQVISINTLLVSHGIVPLYLKGVGNIIDGLYSNIAERIMHDIDLLVPDEQWETSADILINNGYQERKQYDMATRTKTMHYPILFRPGTIASLEIHRLPVNYMYADTLGVLEVWQDKKLVEGNLSCYVMSDRHKIIHSFIHAQLHHEGQLYAKVFLRILYDLLLLSKREDLEAVFTGMNKYHKQAASCLSVMNKTFGIKKSGKSDLKSGSRVFLIRHDINLRTWVVNRSTFLAIKIFRAYFKLPFRAIADKELRTSLIKRLLDRKWYAQHLNSYRRHV